MDTLILLIYRYSFVGDEYSKVCKKFNIYIFINQWSFRKVGNNLCKIELRIRN